ncbi:hypothetical protein EZV62_028087 [Acer yangbiense]|uniref:Pentacotripeptide-repeat region of PRORP domain-containing protein n=1 Tax=Acer yangbiense TaxID=1000413 RepID=A0A5C7GNN4_9ROSI|nr:hypothetical protein EZV62_028087 [Acer yangbiense]
MGIQKLSAVQNTSSPTLDSQSESQILLQPGYFHDARSVDCMVGVVDSLTRRCKTVRGVVDELESVGCVRKAQTFLLLLRVYWRGGMYEMVFEAFEEMGRAGFTPNTFARNVVMDVLFKSRDVDAGIRVLKETPLPNFLSFNIALCNLCKLDDAVSVKDVLRIMLKKGFYPNVETFEMVLNCFCKVGWMAEVFQVLGVITTLGISLSVIGWSVLIDGFCRLSRLDMAGYLLEKMVKSGCSPNVVTYTSLMKGLIEAKMDSHALRILDIMESKGLAPDLVLYNVLIASLSKIGKYDEALDFFVGLSKQKLVPDSYTFSSLLSTLSLSRRFSLSPKLVGGLVVEMDLDLVAYNSLLNYFCKAGFPNHAVELYNYMVDQGFTPDKYSFVGLLSGLCGARRYDEAVNVYKGIVMNYPSLDAHVHTVIMDKLIKVGKCHRSIRLFRRAAIGKYSLDVVSYTVAIRGLLKGGRIGEASTLYSQMKEIGLSPVAHTYNVMLFGFCKERDIEMVQQLMQEIMEAGIKLECGIFGNANQEFLKGYSEDNKLLNTPSSDELSDVAASIVPHVSMGLYSLWVMQLLKMLDRLFQVLNFWVTFHMILRLGMEPSVSPTEETEVVSNKLSEEEKSTLQSRLKQYETMLSTSTKDPTALEAFEIHSNGLVGSWCDLGRIRRVYSGCLSPSGLGKEKPGDPDVLRLLGEVKYELKDYEGSAAAYRLSAMTNASLSHLKDVELLLGKAYSDGGRVSDAVAVYDQLISSYPNDFRGYLAKGIIFKENGRVGDAERMFIQARFFAPENAKALVDRYSKR